MPCSPPPFPFSTWDEWLKIKKTKQDSHLLEANARKALEGGAAWTGEKALPEDFPGEVWVIFLETMLTCIGIRNKAVSDHSRFKTAKERKLALTLHKSSLGYSASEDASDEERTRRKQFEETILAYFGAGGAIHNVEGYGEKAIAHAWQYAPIELRQAEHFKSLTPAE